MSNDERVRELVERILEFCETCPELLPLVRERLRQVRVLEPELELLFPEVPQGANAIQLPAPPAGPATVTYDPDDKPGTMIGRYKLLQKIGEGGMGVVWQAEQREPMHRYVALKIIQDDIRHGRQVLARFEAERQALAMMDHPNIARVLDAGATAAGRPYFVMELVKGIPFTDFCDQRRLTPRERIALFIPVCHAIQHAHH
jgi:hypothetical protein